MNKIIDKKEKDIQLYALERSNSKNPLSKEFRNTISRLRRIESTFNQLIGLQTALEIKFLCFNIAALIGGHTRVSEIINFN